MRSVKGLISASVFAVILLSLAALIFLAGCANIGIAKQEKGIEDSRGVLGSAGTADSFEIPASTAPARPSFKPFYIYTDDRSKDNHFAPSGWMGDTQDLKMSGSYQDNPHSGKTCLKITYLAKGPGKWAGIFWQQPANNWGDRKGGYDLRGAQALTFWARGEKGGEKITEMKMGGITGKYPDSDTAWIGPLKLTREWKMYTISLTGKDLRYINGGFCISVLRAENPRGCTFYIDDIRYE
ncbi:MAG: hypothetical protein ABII64_05435 [Elusimicrobiota bacterium]